MAKIKEVEVLNIDETQLEVKDQSEEVQKMVGVFNNWNQQEADLIEEYTDKISMIRAAKNDLSRSIVVQVKKDQEAVAEANEGVEESLADAE
jgi:hypothetical protein